MNVYFEAFKVLLMIIAVVALFVGLFFLIVLFPIMASVFIVIAVLLFLYFLIVASMQL